MGQIPTQIKVNRATDAPALLWHAWVIANVSLSFPTQNVASDEKLYARVCVDFSHNHKPRDETRGDAAWRDNCCVYALNLVEPIAVKEVN